MRLYLAEEPLGAAAHGEGVVDVHVVILRVRRLLHQRLVDLFYFVLFYFIGGGACRGWVCYSVLFCFILFYWWWGVRFALGLGSSGCVGS